MAQVHNEQRLGLHTCQMGGYFITIRRLPFTDHPPYQIFTLSASGLYILSPGLTLKAL